MLTLGFLTVSEAAKLIGCSRQRVAQLIDEGKIRSIVLTSRFRLVEASDCQKYAMNRPRRGRPKKNSDGA